MYKIHEVEVDLARKLASLPPATTERSPIVKDVDEIPQPPFINETALFKNQWQLKMASATDYLRLVNEKYRPILHELSQEVKEKDWFEPKTVYGYFPAQSEGNEVIVYDAESAEEQSRELLRINFPRQREGRLLSVADFFSPKSSGRMDVIGFSVVTIGSRASEVTQQLFNAGDFTRYLYLHGLSVETAEALAEYMHRGMRKELGIATEDATDSRSSSIRSTGVHAIRLATRPARTSRIRPRYSPC